MTTLYDTRGALEWINDCLEPQKRSNAIHRPRTLNPYLCYCDLWRHKHAPLLIRFARYLCFPRSRCAWIGKTPNFSMTLYLRITLSLRLTCSESRLRKFPRSKCSLFISLLKRHIACWRQSLSMWLPVLFWSEQRLQTKVCSCVFGFAYWTY